MKNRLPRKRKKAMKLHYCRLCTLMTNNDGTELSSKEIQIHWLLAYKYILNQVKFVKELKPIKL